MHSIQLSKKTKHLVIVVSILFVAIAIVGTLFFVGFFGKQVILPDGEVYPKAQSFSLPNESGEIIALENIKADVVIINFWASWSPYSKDDIFALDRLKKEYGKKIAVVALNRDTSISDGKMYVQNLQMDSDIIFVFDSADEYFKKVEGFAVPETMFLIGNEEVYLHIHGPISYEGLKEQLDKILK